MTPPRLTLIGPPSLEQQHERDRCADAFWFGCVAGFALGALAMLLGLDLAGRLVP